ncbi:helix-turn-helix domain-containing protein [Veillonella sp.]|uniref:winged helix-turn-helix transcriptional regulator n=1 Tax=Veillonella sp. TaxID=1926307 RepID=UPI0034564122
MNNGATANIEVDRKLKVTVKADTDIPINAVTQHHGDMSSIDEERPVYGEPMGDKAPCPREKCPVATTLTVLSGKWKGVILYHLLQGTLRFSELQRRMEGVTHRSLTLQLRELEDDGIIERTVYPEVPPRVEYSVSELGRTMEPIIAAMFEWGVQYKCQEKDS